jgi:hypothetical protein
MQVWVHILNRICFGAAPKVIFDYLSGSAPEQIRQDYNAGLATHFK